MREGVVVEALVKGLVSDCICVSGHEVSDLWLEGIPSLTGEGSGDVVIGGVDDFVPKSVKLINIVVVLKGEIVGTFVAVWELAVVAILAMKRLDKVSNVMDDEAQGVRLGDEFIVIELFHEV